MRVGEAYMKVREEMVSTAFREAGLEREGGTRIPPEAVTQALTDLSRYTFDDSLRDLVNQRSRRAARRVIDEVTTEQMNAWQENHDEYYVWLDTAIVPLLESFFSFFAMGYTFFGPENASVARDKDGLVQLCRDVDRDVLAALVARFQQDGLLSEQISGRVNDAREFMSHVFAAQHRALTRLTLRDFVAAMVSIVSLDCFVVGAKVRDLLEQEVAFEAMMKEMDE